MLSLITPDPKKTTEGRIKTLLRPADVDPSKKSGNQFKKKERGYKRDNDNHNDVIQ